MHHQRRKWKLEAHDRLFGRGRRQKKCYFPSYHTPLTFRFRLLKDPYATSTFPLMHLKPGFHMMATIAAIAEKKSSAIAAIIAIVAIIWKPGFLCTPKFCIRIVFNFPWDGRNTQARRSEKQWLCKNCFQRGAKSDARFNFIVYSNKIWNRVMLKKQWWQRER